MTVIFFNLQIPIEDAAQLVFSTLGVDYAEGESLNVLDGIYGIATLLATRIKLEKNAYEYESQYNYSLFVDEDRSCKIATTAHNIRLLSLIIADLLHRNLGIEIAIATDDQLEIYTPG